MGACLTKQHKGQIYETVDTVNEDTTIDEKETQTIQLKLGIFNYHNEMSLFYKLSTISSFKPYFAASQDTDIVNEVANHSYIIALDRAQILLIISEANETKPKSQNITKPTSQKVCTVCKEAKVIVFTFNLLDITSLTSISIIYQNARNEWLRIVTSFQNG